MSQPIQKVSKLNKVAYYATHLAIINAFLPVKLTEREMQVIARVMSFEGEMAQDKFGTSARKILKTDLSMSDGGLGNFLKSMRDKRVIRENPEGKLDIHPILRNNPIEQVYNFKLINEG